MTRLAYDEFVDYYTEKGYLPSPEVHRGKGKLNNKQLKTKYKSYLRKVGNAENKDHKPSYYDEWIEACGQVAKRDRNICRLYRVLTEQEKDLAKQNGYYGQFKRITPAHFIARSRDSKLICTVDNVYQIALVFHGRLDNGENPLTGEFIGKKRVLNEWWKRILPSEVFEKYKDKY